jgi:nicotinamidase-related amidase
MKTALLVIDAQSVFFDGGAMPPVFGAEAVLVRLTGLIARARAAGVPVIFVQHCEDEGLFARTAPGWGLHPALAVQLGEPVVEKTRPDSFFESGLALILDDLEVSHLVIGGCQSEMCVDTTCRAAASLGYRVTLAGDAHATWDGPALSAAEIIAHHNHVLADGGFATVTPSAGIALS